MKQRILSALAALTLAVSLVGTAFAETYSVTLTAEEAQGDVPAALSIPAQTPAAVGAEPNRIVITAPVKGAAVEIAVTGDAKEADVLFLKDDGTYDAADDTVRVSGSVCTMLPGTSATVILLKKPPFTDLSRTAWYYGGVAYAYHNELMSGTSAKKFSPNTSANRAMLVTILWRMAGKPAHGSGLSFSDVAAGQYYTDAVLWAAENNIVTGSKGKFRPNGTMTRQELAVMLYRFAQYTGRDVSGRASLSGYGDGAKVASWAKDAMAWAVDAGLITGSDKKNLTPAGSATRAQLATILMRYAA